MSRFAQTPIIESIARGVANNHKVYWYDHAKISQNESGNASYAYTALVGEPDGSEAKVEFLAILKAIQNLIYM